MRKSVNLKKFMMASQDNSAVGVERNMLAERSHLES